MSLKDQLMIDLKDAMKQKDVIKKTTVTMLRSAVKQVEIDNRVELSDDDIIEIIAKQIKQKKGAIEEFSKAERTDLVEEAEKEISVLSKYLPEPISEEELTKLIMSAIEEVNATSMKDMGKVMSIVNPKCVGRADGKTVSSLVKKMINN
ncbi:GatB/YqeY domain-containing protein [Helicovermis profundi]|uniref:GatB/YqeY domain-containing protein n=1 Tax=Helicovermis profundi TaxID=3065157 RepID=A0AAU9EQM6_9FIRM|nr:GatB/YqeY domain-containing protein [Clostridia bacterium S502]